MRDRLATPGPAPGGGDRPPRPEATRARVADLRPLVFLHLYRHVAPGAEPPREELVRELRAGRQPYSLVVAGNRVLYGDELLSAAKEAGVDTVEVGPCPGCDGLIEADLGLKAAGLHRRAVLDRRKPDPHQARLVGATLYDAWVRTRTPRRPSQAPPARRRERAAQRKSLIEEAFGRAPRTLERDVNLLHLAPALGEVACRGLLPQRAVDAASGLPACRQVSLAARLARGASFESVREEFFGPAGGSRKTAAGAARAIRASIHAIAAEARGREDCFALREEDRGPAEEAYAHLSRWLRAAPRSEGAIEDLVAEVACERRTGRRRAGGVSAPGAPRGGHGVSGGR